MFADAREAIPVPPYIGKPQNSPSDLGRGDERKVAAASTYSATRRGGGMATLIGTRPVAVAGVACLAMSFRANASAIQQQFALACVAS